MADYECHLCGKRTGMMGHYRGNGTYSCQQPAKPKISSGHVKLIEDYGEFEKGTIFALKYVAENSFRVHIAYKETLYIPKSVAEKVDTYYAPMEPH